MLVNRSHILNLLFWVIVIIFMAIQSFQHTISVHYQGVNRSMMYYKNQALTRISVLENIIKIPGRKHSLDNKLKYQVLEIKQKSDTFEFVLLNEALSLFLNENKDSLTNYEKIQAGMASVNMFMDQESLVLHAHAQTFNRLIASFPYAFFSKSYDPFLISGNYDMTKGVIVER